MNVTSHSLFASMYNTYINDVLPLIFFKYVYRYTITNLQKTWSICVTLSNLNFANDNSQNIYTASP